jgi:hypothetical protein
VDECDTLEGEDWDERQRRATAKDGIATPSTRTCAKLKMDSAG